MAKPTMQSIADALGISRVTVWKVFNNQEGVSDSLRTLVLEKAEELGYGKLPFKPSEAGSAKHKTIAVVVSRSETSTFWINIIHRIAQELARHDADLIYVYIPSVYQPGYVLPPALIDGTAQGCIILNIYDLKLQMLINELKIPKVFLDTVTALPETELNGDLVLLEGVHTIQAITEHIIRKGRTRIGFIGDINYARTNADRYRGFCQAMERNNLTILPEYLFTDSLGIHTYQEQIDHFLGGLDALPEAIVCVSDYVANFVLLYLNEHGISVPDKIAVTGYDGSSEYFTVVDILTTVEVNTALLGKRLVGQLLYRMEALDSAREIIYVQSEILFRHTTDF